MANRKRSHGSISADREPQIVKERGISTLLTGEPLPAAATAKTLTTVQQRRNRDNAAWPPLFARNRAK